MAQNTVLYYATRQVRGPGDMIPDMASRGGPRHGDDGPPIACRQPYGL